MGLLATYDNVTTVSPAAGATACIAHGLITQPDWAGLTILNQVSLSTPAILSELNTTSVNVQGGGTQVGLSVFSTFPPGFIR